MTTLIEEFGSVLKQIPNLRVECRASEMLVIVSLADGRTQTVKIVSHRGRRGPYNVLRLLSRACAARDHKMIRSALRTNAGNELGGLALDSTTDPALLDVVYNLVADDLSINELVHALYQVAGLADDIERRVEGRDEF